MPLVLDSQEAHPGSGSNDRTRRSTHHLLVTTKSRRSHRGAARPRPSRLLCQLAPRANADHLTRVPRQPHVSTDAVVDYAIRNASGSVHCPSSYWKCRDLSTRICPSSARTMRLRSSGRGAGPSKLIPVRLVRRARDEWENTDHTIAGEAKTVILRTFALAPLFLVK
jgi:hypothetical protein